jgi:hypothetical protein
MPRNRPEFFFVIVCFVLCRTAFRQVRSGHNFMGHACLQYAARLVRERGRGRPVRRLAALARNGHARARQKVMRRTQWVCPSPARTTVPEISYATIAKAVRALNSTILYYNIWSTSVPA